MVETARELVEVDGSKSVFGAFDIVDGHFAVSKDVSGCEPTFDECRLPHVDVAVIAEIRAPRVLQYIALPLVVVANDEETMSAAVLR